MKIKTENEKDNVIEFVPVTGESIDNPEIEGTEENNICVETSEEDFAGGNEELSELEMLLLLMLMVILLRSVSSARRATRPYSKGG